MKSLSHSDIICLLNVYIAWKKNRTLLVLEFILVLGRLIKNTKINEKYPT